MHIEYVFDKLLARVGWKLDEFPYYSPKDLEKAFAGLVKDPGSFVWKGIEIFWGASRSGYQRDLARVGLFRFGFAVLIAAHRCPSEIAAMSIRRGWTMTRSTAEPKFPMRLKGAGHRQRDLLRYRTHYTEELCR